MSGGRGSSGRGRKRKRRTGGRPRNHTTPSVADLSREGAGSADRGNSLSGDPSSRVVPAVQTPASALQTSSSRGSCSAGAGASIPVRRSNRRNNAFVTPGLNSGSAQGSSKQSSGTAPAPSIRETALDPSRSTGVRGNARYELGYFADRAVAQIRRRRGDHDGGEEVARISRHTSGASDSPEQRRVRDRSTTEGDVPPRHARGAFGRDRNHSTDEGDVIARHPHGASSSPEHRGDSQLDLLREPLVFNQLLGYGIRYTSELLPDVSASSVTSLGFCHGTAISNFRIQHGRHFVTFNVRREEHYVMCGENIDRVNVGIVRPLPGLNGRMFKSFNPAFYTSYHHDFSRDLLAERTDRWGTSDAHCCSYHCGTGQCLWSSWSRCRDEDWEGQEGLPNEGGTIGLLLDLDKGNLAVYKNGRRLGIMMGELSGEYCWYTYISSSGSTVSIERGVLP